MVVTGRESHRHVDGLARALDDLTQLVAIKLSDKKEFF